MKKYFAITTSLTRDIIHRNQLSDLYDFKHAVHSEFEEIVIALFISPFYYVNVYEAFKKMGHLTYEEFIENNFLRGNFIVNLITVKTLITRTLEPFEENIKGYILSLRDNELKVGGQNLAIYIDDLIKLKEVIEGLVYDSKVMVDKVVDIYTVNFVDDLQRMLLSLKPNKKEIW